MEKIKFITDTACDIPLSTALAQGVEEAPLTVTVLGRTYRESYDISPQENYDLCGQSKELPVSAGVNSTEYLSRLERAWQEEYTAACIVCINARGSVCYTAACHARDDFFEEHPEAEGKFRVEIVDSRTYSIAYGIPVMKAARMAKNGRSLDEILAFFDDWFDRVEIYFCPLSFEYVRRSGRVSRTIAFVGDTLGIRPVIHIIEGHTAADAKVRGNGKITEAMEKIAVSRMLPAGDYGILVGTPRDLAEDLERRLTAYTGHPPAVVESAGPCITINGGPRLVAFCCLNRAPRGEFGVTGKLYQTAGTVMEAAAKTAAAAAGTAAKTAAAAAKAGEEILKNVAGKLNK